MNFSRALKSNFRNYSQEGNSAKENLNQTNLSSKFKESLRKLFKDLKEYAKKHPASFTTNIGGLIAGSVGFYYYYLSIQEIKSKKGEIEIRKFGANELLKPENFDEEPDYIVRKDYEEHLNQIIGTLNNRKYVIIVGSKGSGKTTLLKHVINGKEGVVFVKFDGETTLSNFKQKLLKAIKVQIEPWNEGQEAQVFGEICNSIKKTKDGKVIWVPTVIFEIEGSTTREVIKELYKTAKQMSSDNVQARCILVLSDANACLSMTSDSGRQEYIWVGDFTDDEANDYLDKVGFTSDGEIRKMVLEKFGTKPVNLRNLVTSNMKPLEFIEEQIEKDEKKVERCLQKDKNLLKLFKEIQKDEYKDGMDEIIAMNILDTYTEMIAEGPAIKGYHILAFDIEKGKFKFHSNSMREATRRFIEKNK